MFFFSTSKLKLFKILWNLWLHKKVSPLSFVAVFGSGIRVRDKYPGSATLAMCYMSTLWLEVSIHRWKSADSTGIGIRVAHAIRIQHCVQGCTLRAVLRVRIRSRIRMFLGLNPDPLVRVTDPDQAKIVRKTLIPSVFWLLYDLLYLKIM